MSTRIVVDPVTRIEGHLRIEAEIENGIIQDAFSSGTMVRGIEIIVQDRDPREVWAYVGRVCGVCTSIHSLCSVRAVENALGIVIPPNAEMVRNLMQGALLMLVYTLGLALPFLLLALASSWVLQHFAKLKPHMGTLKKIGGALIILMGILLMLGNLNSLASLFH